MRDKKRLMKEIEQLWDDGHAEALQYWGKECIKTSKQGELQGELRAIITFCAILLIVHYFKERMK